MDHEILFSYCIVEVKYFFKETIRLKKTSIVELVITTIFYLQKKGLQCSFLDVILLVLLLLWIRFSLFPWHLHYQDVILGIHSCFSLLKVLLSCFRVEIALG